MSSSAQRMVESERSRPRRLIDGSLVGPPAALMGIVNVTPDSFSDGGRLDPEAAIAHGLRLADEGAAWLDVGGESTRPGATAVDADTQIARVAPVVRGLAQRLGGIAGRAVRISIDTTSAAVARAALDAGAAMVNDISAGADPAMLPLVAQRRVPIVLMHMQGTPATMQRAPRYDVVVAEVTAFLRARADAARAAGVHDEAILVDPGIGFGKTVDHNLALLRCLGTIAADTGLPLVVGLSRKAFLTAAAGIERAAADRDALSHVLHAAIWGDCAILRVHDVAGAGAATTLAASLAAADPRGRNWRDGGGARA